MSEEQFKIWKQVEAKGLEKLEKVEKTLASTEKERVLGLKIFLCISKYRDACKAESTQKSWNMKKQK